MNSSSNHNTTTMNNKKCEKVKVYIRLRPFLEEEYCQNKNCSIECFDTKNKSIQIKKDYERKCFSFDGIFEPKVPQKDVYNSVAQPVIQSVLNGYNGTILAYGQTGTGKTYSMVGTGDGAHKGVIPRALQDIFACAEADDQHAYSIQLSCIQIYMEMVQDLINPENRAPRIRESPENGVFVAGIEWVIVQDESEALQLMGIAESNRAIAFTALNASSSRSHVILMVQVQKRSKTLVQSLNNSIVEYEGYTLQTEGSVLPTGGQSVSLVTSVLYLVDLAGSERVKKSKSTGDRLHEAKAINSSLSALGKCIAALAEGKGGFVPFRESKLTRLLQDSLGGNSKTSLIVTIGPSMKHIDETLSTLAFGQRAMRVANKPIVNKQKDYYLLSAQLQQELDGKDDQIHEMEIQSQHMMSAIEELKGELSRLQFDKQELEGCQEYLKQGLIGRSANAAEMLERQKQFEVEMIEKRYQDMLKKTEDEYKVFLEDVDRTLLEQEQEIDSLKVEAMKSKENEDSQNRQVELLSEMLRAKNEELYSLEGTYTRLEQEKEANERDLIELQISFKQIESAFREREVALMEQVQNKCESLKVQEDVVARQGERTQELERLLRESEDDKAFMMRQLEVKIDQLIEHNRNEVAELKAQLVEKSVLIVQQQEQYSQVLNKSHRVEEDLEEVEEQLMNKEEEFNQLKESRNGDRLKFDEQISKLNEQIEKLQVEKNGEDRMRLEEELVEVKQQLEEVKESYRLLQESLSEEKQSKDDWLEKLKEKVAESVDAIEMRDNTIEQLRQDVSGLLLKVADFEDSLVDYAKQVGQHKAHEKQYQDVIVAKESEIDGMRVEEQRKMLEVDRLTGRNNELNALIEMLQDSLGELSDQNSKQAEEIQRVQEQLLLDAEITEERRGREEQRYHLEVQDLKQLVVSQSQQLSAFIIQCAFRKMQRKRSYKLVDQECVAVLRSDVQKLTDELAQERESGELRQIEYVQQLHEQKQNSVTLCDEISILKHEKAALQSRLVELECAVDEKEKELGNQAEQLSEVKVKLREYTGCIESLQQALQVLEYEQTKEINESKVRRIQMTVQKQALRKEIEALTEANVILQERVSLADSRVDEGKQKRIPLVKKVFQWLIVKHKEQLRQSAGLLIALQVMKKLGNSRYQRELSALRIQCQFRKQQVQSMNQSIILLTQRFEGKSSTRSRVLSEKQSSSSGGEQSSGRRYLQPLSLNTELFREQNQTVDNKENDYQQHPTVKPHQEYLSTKSIQVFVEDNGTQRITNNANVVAQQVYEGK